MMDEKIARIIAHQSTKIFDLEMLLAALKQELAMSKESPSLESILKQIGDLVKYDGDYHNLPSVVTDKLGIP